MLNVRPLFPAVSTAALALLLAAAADAPRPVRVTTVTMVQAAVPLVVSGTVQARTQADLAFRVGGKVTGRPIEIGDHVAGGPGARDAGPGRPAIRCRKQPRRPWPAAQADAANAAADLRRYDGLGRASPAYLPSENDKRTAATRMAAARLIQAQRQVALARDQSAYGRLTADADGIVTALPVQVGQVVAAGQTVATVAHTGAIEVVADVPENRLPAMSGRARRRDPPMGRARHRAARPGAGSRGARRPGDPHLRREGRRSRTPRRTCWRWA